MYVFDVDHAKIGLTNLTNYSVQQFLYSFSFFRSFNSTKSCAFIIFVRTGTLDSQPVTISVIFDSWCSEALHINTLVLLLRDQFDIMCFMTFVMNHGVESASNALISK